MNLSQKLGIAVLLTGPIFAAHAHPHPSFDYVTLGGFSMDEDALGDKYTTYGGIAGISLSHRWYTQISYNKAQDDLEVAGNSLSADFATFGLGFGYRIPMTHASEMTFFVNASDTNGSIDVQGDLYDFTGEAYSAGIGYIVRFKSFELGADLYYAKGSSDYKSPGMQAKIRYFFSDHFSVDINGIINDDANAVGLSLSYHF